MRSLLPHRRYVAAAAVAAAASAGVPCPVDPSAFSGLHCANSHQSNALSSAPSTTLASRVSCSSTNPVPSSSALSLQRRFTSDAPGDVRRAGRKKKANNVGDDPASMAASPAPQRVPTKDEILTLGPTGGPGNTVGGDGVDGGETGAVQALYQALSLNPESAANMDGLTYFQMKHQQFFRAQTASLRERQRQQLLAGAARATENAAVAVGGAVPPNAPPGTSSGTSATWPPDMAVPLLPFQQEGVAWMARREYFHIGGIMADQLGMGKTVQMIALCLARQPPRSDASQMQARRAALEKFVASGGESNAIHNRDSKHAKKRAAAKEGDETGGPEVSTSGSSSKKRKTSGASPAARTGAASDVQPAVRFEPTQSDLELELVSRYYSAIYRIQTLLRQLERNQVASTASKLLQPGRPLTEISAEVAAFVQHVEATLRTMTASTMDMRAITRDLEAGIRYFTDAVDPWLRYLRSQGEVSFDDRARAFLNSDMLVQHFDAFRDGVVAADSPGLLRSGPEGGVESAAGFDDDATPELRTLIVVPASLLMQWRAELERKVKAERGLQVFIYHGLGQAVPSPEVLQHYDFVLTTYSVLHLGLEGGAYRPPSGGGGGSFRLPRGATGGGARAFGGAKRRRAGADDSAGVFAGGGPGGDAGLGSSLPSDVEVGFDRTRASPLFRVHWKRLILDEAHVVRNPSSVWWRAVSRVRATKRWAVTATPLHNTVGDLQTLLAVTGLPRLPISNRNESMLMRDPTLQRGIARALRPCFLRRNPTVREEDGSVTQLVVLPPKTDQVRLAQLTSDEVTLYNSSLRVFQSKVGALSANGDRHRSSAMHAFAMMTKLRQACCHPWLIEGRSASEIAVTCGICQDECVRPVYAQCGHTFCFTCLTNRFAEAAADAPPEDEVNAADAGDGGEGEPQVADAAGPVLSPTGAPRLAQRVPCPCCGTRIQRRVLFAGRGESNALAHPKRHRAEIVAEYLQRPWTSSSKLEMLLDALRRIMATTDDKVVVFSQFTSFLDVIGIAIERAEMRSIRIDGSLDLKTRDRLIEAFTESGEIRVLLASKMAMGVGLNLVAANHVIVVDPWWNPAVEEQAVHRVYRIGQTKPVFVQRFVMGDTIEQYCYNVSCKKKEFSDSVMGAASSRVSRAAAAAAAAAVGATAGTTLVEYGDRIAPSPQAAASDATTSAAVMQEAAALSQMEQQGDAPAAMQNRVTRFLQALPEIRVDKK